RRSLEQPRPPSRRRGSGFPAACARSALNSPRPPLRRTDERAATRSPAGARRSPRRCLGAPVRRRSQAAACVVAARGSRGRGAHRRGVGARCPVRAVAERWAATSPPSASRWVLEAADAPAIEQGATGNEYTQYDPAGIVYVRTIASGVG